MRAPLAARALLRRCLPRDRYEAIAGDLSEIFAAERRRHHPPRAAPLLAGMAVCGAVAIVLLLACVNVANLLLARGVARQKELGIRAALGAGRLRLLRQLLTESLLLTVLGAALGTVMAAWAIDALRGTLPEVVLATTPNLHALSMNPRTLGFAAIVSIATGMLFGVIPAVRIGRQDAHAVLRETGRTGAGRGSQRPRAMLVAGEAALSFVLLTATGLMLRSLTNLLQVDVGFNAERVLTFSIALPDYQYPDAESRLAFYTQALERFRALPGVESGAAVNTLPFSTYNRGTGFRSAPALRPRAAGDARGSGERATRGVGGRPEGSWTGLRFVDRPEVRGPA